MTTEFTRQFFKDLDKIKQPSIKTNIADIIKTVQAATSLSGIINLKKLKGHSTAFRIRVGDYRIGLIIENNIVEFNRIAHRKDIYNLFP